MKPDEVRERFDKVLVESDSEVLDYLSDAELKEIGEMIERLEIDEIKNTRERIEVVLEELKDKEDPRITKTQLAGIIGRSTKTVQNHTPKEKDEQVWAGLDENQVRVYAHADAIVDPKTKSEQDKELRESIVEAHQKAEDILGGYRQPTLEETAFIGGFDAEDKQFRKTFFQIKQQEDWAEPSQKEIEDWKDELTSLIAMAAASTMEGVDPMEIPGEEIYSVEEYAEKNKELIEKIEIQETKVGYDLRLPTKLVEFTDQRIIYLDREDYGLTVR